MTYYASIKRDFKQKLLKRSTFLGALGVIPLVLSAWFGTAAQIEVYGLPLFILCIGIISLGMIPLRNVERVESNPPSLSLSEKHLIYKQQGKLMQISRGEISKIEWITRGERYGISITLSDQSIRFFPYFSEKTAYELSNALFDDVLHSEEP